MQLVKVHSASFALIIVLSTFVACTVKEPCDDDQTVKYGLCLDPPEEGDQDASSEDDNGNTSSGDFDSSSDSDDSTSGGGDGGAQSSVDEANVGADCAGQLECKGGTVCGADNGLAECIALCGAGDPFDGNCPGGMGCVEVVPGTSMCIDGKETTTE